MANEGIIEALTQLRRSLASKDAAGQTDGELLGAFVERRDEAAFEALVRRHGPMVLGVCRRILGHRQDVEDAFQATFVVLVLKAASVARRDLVGNWLYGVAHRTAVRARALGLQRRGRERQVADMPEAQARAAPGWDDLRPVLDEELSLLPESYRAVLVLCDVEGRTRKDAARHLRCPEGSVSSRLSRARALLARRLVRRGVALSGGALGLLLAQNASPACVSAALVGPAVQAVGILAAGQAAGVLSPAVAALSEEVMNAMALTKLKTVTALLLVLGMIGFGGALLHRDRAAGQPPGSARTPAVGETPRAGGPPAGAGIALKADPKGREAVKETRAMGPEPTPPPSATRPAPAPGARDGGPSLLFTELVLKPGQTATHTLRLVRQRFRDGKPDAREEIYTGDASEFGYQGRYWLVGERTVVLESTTVIDVADRKVLHRFDGGRVLAVEGAKVYFYSMRETGEVGVFCFDLTARKREKVAGLGEGRWGLRGALSPDGSKAIVRLLKNGAALSGAEMLYTLALDRVGKPRVSLGEFAASCGATGGGGVVPEPPGVWLDNDRFVTQKTLGEVVVLNTADGTVEKVVSIPPTHRPGEKVWDTIGASGFTPLGFQQPRFARLPDGRVKYEADVVYFIDVAAKTWEKPAWQPLGHGFDYSAVPDKVEDVDRYTREVTVSLRHRGTAIGTSTTAWWTTPEKPRVVAADGHLAVIYKRARPGQVPTDAVRVWTAATGQWHTLDAWADSLIGWVK